MFHTEQVNHNHYCGIFLISFSILMLEITLTKIFSVTMWYHFSYLVISLAMFGIGFGGLLVYQLKNSFKIHINKNLYMLSIMLAISMLLSLQAALACHLPNSYGAKTFFNFLSIYLLCTAPFALSSMILSILFLNWPHRSGRIYGADLLGAAMGCIGCVILISYFSAPQVILIACLGAVIAATLFQTRVYSLVLIICFIVLILFSNGIFQITQTKNYSELTYHKLFEKWSPLSRITVFPQILAREQKAKAPFGWGMSKKYTQSIDSKQLWIEQDASAGTPIVPFNGDFSTVNYLKFDITALPYYLRKKANIFILGVGGGRDVLTALVFKNEKITGVDIHPIMIDLLKNKYADYAGHIYQNKYVNISVSDGRAFLAKSKERFDIIQIPLIDSWAATVAGAFAMTENSLYTTEAFITYLQHLTSQGLLSVTRFYFSPDNQTIKTALLARTAMEVMGIPHPERHIAIVKNVATKDTTIATLLVKREPFSLKELKQIKTLANELAFTIVYLPSDSLSEPLFEKGLSTKHLNQFVDQYYYDIRPTTDDRPFFFQMFYPSKLNDLFSHKNITGQIFNYYGVAALYLLLLISTFLLFLFYMVPFLFAYKSTRPSLQWGSYFILLGLGFMFIEIPFVQEGAVYLESPIYGLAVSLFGLLLFGGVGSIWSGQSIKILRICLALTSIFAAILPYAFHFLMQHTFGNAWSEKLIWFLMLLCPMSLCMGVALPSGIRMARVQFTEAIPWFWALNGAASVLGSIIAMAVSVSYGYSFALILGAITYFLALIIVALI